MSSGDSSRSAVNTPEPTHDGSRYKSNLEEYEMDNDGKPPFILTYPEVKLLGIAGVRAFNDLMVV